MDVYFQRDGWRKIGSSPPMCRRWLGLTDTRFEGGGVPNESASGKPSNSFYRLTVDKQTGAITNLFDKSENRELAVPKRPTS